MKRTFILSLSCLICFFNLAFCQRTIDLSHPPQSPELFAENFISTSMYERDIAISPDGTEIFYTTMIPFSNFQTLIYTRKIKNTWSKPKVISFSGKYSDLEPVFSSDGKKLFFVSNRPLEGDNIKDFDIWYVERNNSGWSDPKNIGAPVNTSADEFYPSIAGNGNLYYTAQYKGGVGREDIYVSKWENSKYATPIVLDTMINSNFFEFNAFVSPDEKFIIFSSQGRKDEKGRGDLYISVKDENNKWKQAKNLTTLNSERLDYCPFVSFDKKIFFFTSESHSLKRSFEKPILYNDLIQSVRQTRNGGGNIYWVDFKVLNEYFK